MLMSTRVWGEEYRTIHVCVDAYQSGVLSGRFYNQSLTAGKSFQCLFQFLQEMERTLDGMDFPRAYTAPRTFGPAKAPEALPPEEEHNTGALATFAVRVLFRQNASWQGSVTWLEGKQEQSFRSALEMIFLISSALENKKAS